MKGLGLQASGLGLILALSACAKHEGAKEDAAAKRIDAAAIDARLADAKTADAKPTGPLAVVHGAHFTCSLLDDGSVTCQGEIGFGAAAKNAQPAAVPGVDKAQRLYAIGGAACAIADGTVACWGDVDERGRITHTGAHRTPTAVFGATKELVTGALEVAATGDAACALHEDGTVACASPHPLCPKKPAPRVRKPKAESRKPKAGSKKPPPPPPEPPKPGFEELHVPKAAHLAFDRGLCVLTQAKKLECQVCDTPRP